MGQTLIDLPEEILLAIVKDCGTKELVALAPTCKRLSKIVPEKLYRHLYFRQVSKSECLDLDDFESYHVSDEVPIDNPYRWTCGRCSKECMDVVFYDAGIPSSWTWIKDLCMFSKVLEQSQRLRGFIHTIRLDIQTRDGWNPNVIFSVEELGLWTCDEHLETAISSIESSLSHLSSTRAGFSTECSHDEPDVWMNPRVIQTLGMPLPFIYILPDAGIERKSRSNHNPSSPVNAESYDVADWMCSAGISLTPKPVEKLPPGLDYDQHFTNLLLYEYKGPLTNLGELLGAPQDPLQYRSWLTSEINEKFQTNYARYVILRLLRRVMDDVDYAVDNLDEYRHLSGKVSLNHVIGDTSCLESYLSGAKRYGKLSKYDLNTNPEIGWHLWSTGTSSSRLPKLWNSSGHFFTHDN